MDKATRGQVKRHNRRLVMRALVRKLADNRAALSVATQLTKPTIGTIVSELIDAGYVSEIGYGISTSSGGKRPTLIEFVPTARQVIAVSIAQDEIIAQLAYLDGTVVARHHMVFDDNDDIQQALYCTINALIAQKDAELLCIGVGLSGIVDSSSGIVVHSESLRWTGLPLAQNLTKMYDVPSYIGNNTELSTRVQVRQSTRDSDHLVTVSIGDAIEIGSTFGGDIYQHSEDIGQLFVPKLNKSVGTLRWKTVKATAKKLIEEHPNSVLASQKFTYLLLRRAVMLGEAPALELLDEMATILAHVYRWIIGLMRPSEIVLAGSMSELGQVLLDAVEEKLHHAESNRALTYARLTLAQANYLSLEGALVYALQEELGI